MVMGTTEDILYEFIPVVQEQNSFLYLRAKEILEGIDNGHGDSTEAGRKKLFFN